MTAASRSVDVLLVGGGVASARCARNLRWHGFTGSILLVGDEERAPYNRPPLSKEVLRGEVPAELTAVEPDGWYGRHQVELATGVAVEALRASEREAQLSDGSVVRFDRCLLATGAAPRRPPIPGAEHALLLRTAVDAAVIRDRVQAMGGEGPAVVIGGGFIGVEVAASLAPYGVAVTLLEATSALWAGALGDAVSDWATGVLARLGVRVRVGTLASRMDGEAVWVGEERIPAALVVAGVGVEPRTALAETAGLAVDDGIVVDSQRSAAPGIFAAGDVARIPNPAAGDMPIRVEHWHSAREGGDAAALGMLGNAVPPARAPWVYTEFAGQLLEVVGWAPDGDEELVRGDSTTDRFAVAYVRGGRVAQLAVANGLIPVESARAFVEARRPPSELSELIGP
jgi:3-phenylpropionate/trans-cinnamate dioxygenase ferredoxin reductase subunit